MITHKQAVYKRYTVSGDLVTLELLDSVVEARQRIAVKQLPFPSADSQPVFAEAGARTVPYRTERALLVVWWDGRHWAECRAAGWPVIALVLWGRCKLLWRRR